MKVKCRGYEGELVSLYANFVEDVTGYTVFATYDVEIKLRPSENITIRSIHPAEIEVINAKTTD